MSTNPKPDKVIYTIHGSPSNPTAHDALMKGETVPMEEARQRCGV